MRHISQVLGSRLEPAFAEQLHDLAHRAAIDIVTISTEDLNRRRLRIATRSGEELAIALPREQKLFDGAVLLIDSDGCARLGGAGLQRNFRDRQSDAASLADGNARFCDWRDASFG